MTGISIHVTTPASVSKLIAPNARFCMVVSPAEKSCVKAPDWTLSPPESVEVDVVESALKYVAATLPLTESLAYGDVVLTPTLPFASIVSAAVVDVANVAADDVAR